MDVVEVPGATGWFDTDYEGKRDAALRTLADGADLFLIHVEATDEAGHAGDLDEKIKALETWDRRILAGLVDGLDALGPWRLLLLPDHPTPVELRTHTSDSVPVPAGRQRGRRPGRDLHRGRHRRRDRGARARDARPPSRSVSAHPRCECPRSVGGAAASARLIDGRSSG